MNFYLHYLTLKHNKEAINLYNTQIKALPNCLQILKPFQRSLKSLNLWITIKYASQIITVQFKYNFHRFESHLTHLKPLQ